MSFTPPSPQSAHPGSSTPIDMEINEPWWSAILDGTKTIEGRKGSPKWLGLAIGNTLRCIEPKSGRSFLAMIVGIRKYYGEDPLVTYLTQEGVARVLPGAVNLTTAISIYLQWSTPAEIQKYGMMAIAVKVISFISFP
jgi:ASC-1-like (ASCH) protein